MSDIYKSPAPNYDSTILSYGGASYGGASYCGAPYGGVSDWGRLVIENLRSPVRNSS